MPKLSRHRKTGRCREQALSAQSRLSRYRRPSYPDGRGRVHGRPASERDRAARCLPGLWQETTGRKARHRTRKVANRLRAFSAKPRPGQLAHNRFDVERQAFGDSGYEDAIAHLVEHGKYAILEGVNESGVRIRLRHDVIDAHNIANLLQDDPKLFSEVLGSREHKGKLHLGFGQLLFEGVAQAAHDRRQNRDRGVPSRVPPPRGQQGTYAPRLQGSRLEQRICDNGAISTHSRI